ncbi:MAG: HDOD domain-containing protein [bacterium]|nr:HDOD domain-containing protein [bacterium]
MEKQDILEKLFSADRQLPTLPVILAKLNEMLENPMTSNKKIADLITKDQAMVTKILKLSNSAMYSMRQEITSLANAITFLGTHTLKTVILQISLVKVFTFKGEDIPEFSITTFWEHSLGTAYFTNLIVKKLKLPANENYYVAGLLHDIGKLVIYQFYPEKFHEIIKLQIDQNLIDYEAEEKVLGVNHNDIGEYLGKKWNFDEEITNVIKFHHDAATSQPLPVAVVQVSNLFAKAAGLCFPWDNKFFEIVGDPNWEVIAQHAKDADIEDMVGEIMEESASVKESVTELLSRK